MRDAEAAAAAAKAIALRDAAAAARAAAALPSADALGGAGGGAADVRSKMRFLSPIDFGPTPSMSTTYRGSAVRLWSGRRHWPTFPLRLRAASLCKWARVTRHGSGGTAIGAACGVGPAAGGIPIGGR